MIQDLREIEELLNDIDGKHIGFFDVKRELKDLVKKVQTQALSIANVSVSQLMSERMTWLLDYVWCCDVNELTDKETEALEKRLAEEKAVIEWLYSR